MDEQLIQRTRYIIRSRFRKVQSCPKSLFTSYCLHLFKWIEVHPILKPLSIPFLRNIEQKDRIQKILDDIEQLNGHFSYDPGKYKANDSIEFTALCYYILKASADIDKLDEFRKDFIIQCFTELLTHEENMKIEDAIDVIRDVVIDGLFEYYDEQLDSRNAIYALLIKFKQNVEWFKKHELREISIGGYNNKKGERALAIKLQEYIFNQGVEFIIEPSSASGEVDLILREPEGRYLILDAKYIPEDASKSVVIEKLSGGFHQVMRYCEDYNESQGFLITFNASKKRISLNIDQIDGISYFSLGAKAIYHVFISISDELSASKSGKAEEIIIEEKELKIESL